MSEIPTLVGRYPAELPGAFAPGSQSVLPNASPAAGQADGDLKQVAEGFEALFLRQMLASASKADFGGEDLFGSSGEDTFREMRDARFAEIAAKTGTIGLASQIEAQLARQTGNAGTTNADTTRQTNLGAGN